MDAATLYSQIKTYANLDDTTICHLHKSNPGQMCIGDTQNGCMMPSQTQVVDFDSVKVLFCKKNNISPQFDSVDAVTHKKQLFLFVEIKSIENIVEKELKYDKKIKKQIDNKISTTDKKEVVNRFIESKVKGFCLKEKIKDSIEICKGITNDGNLFSKIDFVYVLITDTDTLSNPMQQFQAHLNVLSYNAVKLKMESELKKEHLSVGHRNRYARCKEFDKFMAQL